MYNAAKALIEPNLVPGKADRIAFIDDAGAYSYAELADRVARFANILTDAGIMPEQRILLCLNDSIDFPTCFLGAITAGAVPVPVNTRLTGDDYAYMAEDSGAVAAVVSQDLLPAFSKAAESPHLELLLVSGADQDTGSALAGRLNAASPDSRTAPTRAEDMCFWLYTSGTTGKPKGAVHLHRSLEKTAELYAANVLGLGPDDVVLSGPKLYFAYGLGNGLTFPLSVGATSVLMAEPPSPAALLKRFRDHDPTVFFGVPTLYAMMLANEELCAALPGRLRLCVSAGEALPPSILARWRERTGLDIVDGIGSTEMLHVFLSNRPDAVTPGSTGTPVPGYRLKIIDEWGEEVATGNAGELLVSGPSSAAMYWGQAEKSATTFIGGWTRTGDQFRHDETGHYYFCGRSDDMLKVGGIYVSPGEVEDSLLAHDAVLEAAVIGAPDPDGLIKPKAFVVLKDGFEAGPAMAEALIDHTRASLASFKRPRWIEFMDSLPKTATGKIQRFKLRAST